MSSNTNMLSPAEKFKLTLSAMEQSARTENKFEDFLSNIPQFLSYIMKSFQVGAFTANQTAEILNYLFALEVNTND